MLHPLEILRQYWHFESFRAAQQEIIDTVLNGRDTLAMLPTGGGKSLCFQVPAMAKEGICVVVSPLVALIKNQVDALRRREIKAAALLGGMRWEEIDHILDNCIYGNYKFLYLSPERLEQGLVKERIKRMRVNLIAIDEAHCISQWGHDFRPAYRNCALLRGFFPNTPIIALTASATRRVAEDIIENLQLRQPAVIKNSFARENLAYMVFEEPDKLYKTALILKKNKGSSIVYVRNRKATADVAAYLNRENIKATFYHGGISPQEKNTRLEAWLHNQVQVMVATSAFGMGIDKPDVRTVIHIQLPENIENYYQEAGRGGRDGKKSFAIVLKNKGDEKKLKAQFLDTFPEVAYIKTLYRNLNNHFQIPYGEGKDTTFPFRFNDFCSIYNLNNLLAYNGMKLLERCAVLTLSDSFKEKVTLHCTANPRQLLHYLDRHPRIQPVVQAILRTYNGLFDSATSINLHLIAAKINSSEAWVSAVLEQLQKDDMALYVKQRTDAEVTFLKEREDDKTIYAIAPYVRQQRELKTQQLQAVIDYVANDSCCKSVQLLSYFGETDAKPCNICSVCVAKKNSISPKQITLVKEAILQALDSQSLTSRSLLQVLSYKEMHIIEALRKLLEEEKISLTSRNEYEKK